MKTDKNNIDLSRPIPEKEQKYALKMSINLRKVSILNSISFEQNFR
ncbi:hypothetical protein VIBNISO65_970087 [Vibrio nigripulchritudo SO65]|nr:hypothetical protein VIBNIAM115_1200034 [Vibrio nigripulchritudo AM115]CCN42897.1 hypothetical protein VIBNIFTn2_420033 [Vibrio nigripulchritudo FTn2]CCN65460.1 hypothetical protein VIBNIPon4_390087 [Vibrio nigripulchritudo POn4]CCN79525.1 hypothetical protein VIBNISO65_970087 [Vibrio nigripulchritudo SO65]